MGLRCLFTPVLSEALERALPARTRPGLGADSSSRQQQCFASNSLHFMIPGYSGCLSSKIWSFSGVI